MQVKELMSKNVITVTRSTTLKALLTMFIKFHIFPLVPVVDEQGHLAGIVSFQNLLNVFRPYNPELLKAVPFLDEEGEDNIFHIDLTEEVGNLVLVEDIMEQKIVSLREDMSIEEAFNLMKMHLKEEFPVVDKNNTLVGMIGVFDIIREVFHQKGVI
ncbi:MAG: CBS domain-containing protein [Candidatus Omnitrophica bacterium]|nr:CBS domain-containing protein [Candidatus Omnitrophota bacterium]